MRKYIDFEENYADKYEFLNELSWDSIHVEQRDVEDGFPDVTRNGAFGIMFNTSLTVTETYMYRFELISDDGSILWVDDKLIIDNDYSRGMHSGVDTIALRAGTHDIRIWYYQAYPTMFGVIFDSEPVDEDVIFDIDTILLNQDLIFDIGSSKIKSQSHFLLDSLGRQLQAYKQAQVRILGHTDDTGSSENKHKLSEHRANAIRDYLMQTVDHVGVTYVTRGLGEKEPIASNRNEDGRSKNRRVEILVEGY